MPSIGDLRHRVTLQTKATTPGSGTSTGEVFSLLAAVWAGVETLSGTRAIDGVNAGAGATHVFTIRDRSDVDSEVMILFDSRRFSIQDVERVNERGRFLRLLCEERRDL